MSKSIPPTARDLYLASLSPEEELAARRVAEKSGIPDNDPTWLLLSEVRSACREATRCTNELKGAVADAASRIECAGTHDARTALDDEALTAGIASTAGAKLAENEQIVGAIASGIRRVENDASRAMRTLEGSIRDFMRRRVSAPAASLVFAFALGIASACLSIWGTYHIAVGYGEGLGYRAGFNDGRVYERNHP